MEAADAETYELICLFPWLAGLTVVVAVDPLRLVFYLPQCLSPSDKERPQFRTRHSSVAKMVSLLVRLK